MRALSKNRIPLLVTGLMLAVLALLLFENARAIDARELGAGTTLQPGNEISVSKNGGEYSYSFYAGGCGALREPAGGVLQAGGVLILPGIDDIGLAVDDGYEFAGWYCTCSGHEITISAQYSAQPVITFTERAQKYGLASNADRMSYGKTVYISVSGEYAPYILCVTANGVAADKTDSGYVFTMPEGNVTVDATVNENACVVRFTAGGGLFADGEGSSTVLVPLENGKGTASVPDTPERDYYIFKGWYTEVGEKAVDDSVVFSAHPFDTVTYTARWEIDPAAAIMIEFDPMGGTAAQSSVTALPGQPVTLPFARRDGSTFLGWSTAADGSGNTYKAGERLCFDSAATLYAQWQAADCIVTVSVRQAGNAVTDLDSAVLTDAMGGIIRGEGDGNGVFIFRNVPDGQYTLKLSGRSREGVSGSITVSNGKAESSTLQVEMW